MATRIRRIKFISDGEVDVCGDLVSCGEDDRDFEFHERKDVELFNDLDNLFSKFTILYLLDEDDNFIKNYRERYPIDYSKEFFYEVIRRGIESLSNEYENDRHFKPMSKPVKG